MDMGPIMKKGDGCVDRKDGENGMAIYTSLSHLHIGCMEDKYNVRGVTECAARDYDRDGPSTDEYRGLLPACNVHA